MRVFVVLDTKGCGHVLGVFDSRQRAEQITGRYPAYYHLYPAGLMGEVEENEPAGRGPGGPCRGSGEPGQQEQVHVVLNTTGHYHVVGVMADRRVAERLVRRSPAYSRICTCAVNRINPEVLDWAGDDEQREFLASLIRSLD